MGTDFSTGAVVKIEGMFSIDSLHIEQITARSVSEQPHGIHVARGGVNGSRVARGGVKLHQTRPKILSYERPPLVCHNERNGHVAERF
jgi:hypothetical protein